MLRSLIVFYLSTTLFSWQCHAQGTQDEKYDNGIMTFDLTFNNPNASKTLHVVKVGVKNKVLSGDFECLPYYSVSTPLADYLVWFWVGKSKETIIEADPILAIEPQKTVRFTISIIPDATGACTYWSCEVNAVVVFDDGTRYYSQPQK